MTKQKDGDNTVDTFGGYNFGITRLTDIMAVCAILLYLRPNVTCGNCNKALDLGIDFSFNDKLSHFGSQCWIILNEKREGIYICTRIFAGDSQF